MKALAWRLLWLRVVWRALCLLLAPAQWLAGAVVRAVRALARAADDAEVEVLLALTEQRIRAKRQRAGKGNAP